ncbi:uncharacterized protein LOC144945909 [Lampetra fluviatilis]
MPSDEAHTPSVDASSFASQVTPSSPTQPSSRSTDYTTSAWVSGSSPLHNASALPPLGDSKVSPGADTSSSGTPAHTASDSSSTGHTSAATDSPTGSVPPTSESAPPRLPPPPPPKASTADPTQTATHPHTPPDSSAHSTARTTLAPDAPSTTGDTSTLSEMAPANLTAIFAPGDRAEPDWAGPTDGETTASTPAASTTSRPRRRKPGGRMFTPAGNGTSAPATGPTGATTQGEHVATTSYLTTTGAPPFSPTPADEPTPLEFVPIYNFLLPSEGPLGSDLDDETLRNFTAHVLQEITQLMNNTDLEKYSHNMDVFIRNVSNETYCVTIGFTNGTTVEEFFRNNTEYAFETVLSRLDLNSTSVLSGWQPTNVSCIEHGVMLKDVEVLGGSVIWPVLITLLSLLALFLLILLICLILARRRKLKYSVDEVGISYRTHDLRPWSIGGIPHVLYETAMETPPPFDAGDAQVSLAEPEQGTIDKSKLVVSI